jgi:hypothetical protein
MEKSAAASRPVQLRNAQRAHNLARGLRGDNRSSAPTDAQQQQLLERLRQAGDDAPPFAALLAAGAHIPGRRRVELELNGYVVRRVYEHTAGWSAGACSRQNPRVTSSRPAGVGHTDSQPRYISQSPRIAQAWVNVSAALTVVAFPGAVRLGGLRSRAYRCSHGHRPSGCDTEARGRRVTLPQRHRRGVGGSLTQIPRRRAYRLQRPCSLPIVRAYLGSA